jgi:predicted phage terminase large subunit-like protein
MDKALLIEYAYKHWGDDAQYVLTSFPPTGPGGLRRMLGEIYPEYFCKAYMPDQFEREFGDYAIELLHDARDIINAKIPVKEARVAPRGHAKSTIWTVAVPAWATVYQKVRYILFISANEDTACNFLGKVKIALESPEIIEDFGAIKGTRGNWLSTWNDHEIETTSGITVECTGWTAGIRGKNKKKGRPDLVIFDDLEDKKVMESQSLKEKLERAFTDEMLKLGDYDTIYFYVGTLLAVDSLLARTIKKPTWKFKLYKKVVSFPDEQGEKLWEEWRLIFRDLYNDNRMEDAYNYYLSHKEDMLRGVNMLWEGKYPEDLMTYKGAYYNTMLEREESEDSFWQEDQNEPRNSDNMKFRNIRYWESWPDKIKSLKLAIDPSEGKGDSTAYVCGGEMNGGYFIKEGRLALHDPYQIMAEVVRFVQEYPLIDEIILESNLFKDLLKTELIKALCAAKMPDESSCYRTVTHRHASDNKHIRIMKMEPDINGQKVLFNEINSTFNKQIKDYHPKASHDDAPDALQILISSLKKPSYYIK